MDIKRRARVQTIMGWFVWLIGMALVVFGAIVDSEDLQRAALFALIMAVIYWSTGHILAAIDARRTIYILTEAPKDTE